MFKTAFGATLVAAALAPAASQAAAIYAPVVSSTPVTQQVTVPQQVCGVEQQVVHAQPSGVGALIGAVAGGLFGNAVGGGSRAIATGVGAVAGAALGNTVEVNAAANYPAGSVPVQRCQTVNAYQTRTVGYDVVYEYNGQTYHARLANPPGDRIALHVAPADAQAPQAEAPPPAAMPPGAPPVAAYPQPVAPYYPYYYPAYPVAYPYVPYAVVGYYGYRPAVVVGARRAWGGYPR